MKKSVFNALQKIIGAKVEWEHDQRAFDFVLVGARKACLVTEPITFSPLFKMAFDVYEAYPEGVAMSHGEQWKALYGKSPMLIVKKGTDVSDVLFEKDGHLFYRHVELGILLGFPPEECLNFHTIQERKGVDYYGLMFACEKSRLDSAIAYLEKTFSLPQWMKEDYQFIIR